MFNEDFVFSIIAKQNVRLLTLDQNFFIEKRDIIEGLEDCLFYAESFVECHSIPVCDFKLYEHEPITPKQKFIRAVKHIKILNKMHSNQKGKFYNMMKAI